MDDELREVFAAHVVSYWKEGDDPEFDDNVIAEVTDQRGSVIELSFEMGKRHVYLSLRREDFLRATDDPE